jgi:hypothetical protein
MPPQYSRTISHADRLWPLSTSVTVFVGLQVAFWLGVIVTMATYQIGFLDVVR